MLAETFVGFFPVGKPTGNKGRLSPMTAEKLSFFLSPHVQMTKCCISNFIIVQPFICITPLWLETLFSYDQISILEISMCLVNDTFLEFHYFKHLLQAVMKPHGFHLHLLASVYAYHPLYNLSYRVSHHPGHRNLSLSSADVMELLPVLCFPACMLNNANIINTGLLMYDRIVLNDLMHSSDISHKAYF